MSRSLLVDGRADSRVNGHEFRQRFGFAPATAAFGRNAKARREVACGSDARLRSCDAVHRMDETEIKLGPLFNSEPLQRREISFVRTLLRYRKVQPVEGARQAAHDTICDRNKLRRIGRLLEMPAAAVTVAE